MANVILVTGGTGLVGKAIEHIIATEHQGSRFAKKPNERWIFASSSEADLRSDHNLLMWGACGLTRVSCDQGPRTDERAV